MTNKKTNEEDGVWRTIGGRRVFIRNGQSLADAMKESGKFSNLNKNVSSHKHPSEVKKLDDKHSYKVEEGNPLEEMANERMNEKKKKYEKDLDYVNRILKGEKVIDDKYNEELSLDVAKKWLRDDYVYLNGLSSYSPEEIDARLEKDLPDIFGKEELPESWTKYKEDSQIYKDWNKLTGKINDEVDYKNEELPEIVDNYLQKEGFTEDNGYSKEYIKNLKDNAVSSLHYTEYDKNELSNFGITDEDIKNAEEYSKTVNRRPWSEIKKEQDDYEYNLYKQSKEDPDSINSMTEWSTDWEELDKKYKDRYDKEFKASMGEVDIPEDFTAQFNDYAKKHDDLRLAKEKALQTKKDAENKWIEHYNNSNWNDENWRKEDDRLSQERDKSREEYDKAMKEYLAVANDNELSWEDKVARNDIQMEKELEEINAKRDSGDYRYNMDKWSDDYYGTFRKYEKENAKLKAEGAKPEDEYVPLNSWGSFHNKMEELTKDNENAKWTGKEYTNDEFMEHLEDANWHTERRMLETAGLTNQEMEYIKDHTTLAAWSADLDRDKTQKLINEAKDKFRNNDKTNETNRKIADHLQNVSNVAKRMGDEKNAREYQLASDYARSQITNNSQSSNETSNSNVPKKYEKGNAPFESKRVAENEIREKGYQYFSTHGVGPGTHPNDVKSRELDIELPGGWTTFKTDRPLTQQELDYYDIQPETRNSEFRKRFGLNEDNTKKTTNQTMNDAIRQSASKKSSKSTQSTSQRYSGTISYLKNMGLSQSQIDAVLDRFMKENKK